MSFIVSSLLLASLISGGYGRPVELRQAAPEVFKLPIPAEGPGPTFDATATRVATNAQIRNAASPDLCFDVSDFRAGDFRFNLVPLALKPCNPSIDGQKFDLITKGAHNNNQDGTKTLIVSSQQFTCVDRRGNKNDRTRPGLFACGGRAVGDGETTDDQQFFFNLNGTATTGFTLVKDSKNQGVGAGNACMTLNKDGFVSNTPCSPPNFTPEQTWIIGDAPAGSPPPTVPDASTSVGSTSQPASTTATSTSSSSSPSPTSTSSSASTPSSTPGAPEKFVLPAPGNDGPGPTFDASATRAATAAHIRNAGSPNLCFDVSDFRAGDFRFNLVPIALKTCDAATDGQKFDLITKGAHNNVQDGSRTIIVSSQQFTCVDRRSNIKDRTRPGLFACGGRAAGDGETTADQQYFFDQKATIAGGIGFPLVQNSVNNGVGPGNQCLTLDADGFLRNTPCSPPNFSPEQTWIVGDLGNGVVPATPPQASPVNPSPVASSPSSLEPTQSSCQGTTVTATSTVTVTVTSQPQATAAPSSSAATSSPTSTSSSTLVAAPSPTTKPDVFVLPKPEEGPGPTFDNTATRAAKSVQIRSAASDTCFDVSNFKAGDFRFNLVPVALKKCDATVDGQKFDLITKGAHNDVADGSRTLIVSSQQFTCVDRRSNINDRTRPGLFACGGRAAGDGGTTADQQYFFNKAGDLGKGIGFPLVRDAVNNGVGPGNKCLTLKADGFLSNEPCSPPNFSPEQTWIVG
ncbi:hypothetical protein D9611_003399 [Ephemerocybe angulata]|uniref:Uncharacterized protein n=1 Tax=Ephemerocybe angulata TaxID=980116 RepID=A0A8H5C8N6_9AGAR|nr:hypothetical protein D9611_003399 [Tulosesus angulatus]